MRLTRRPLQNEGDYWRIRGFLRDVFLLNGCQERSWHVARLDYWRWHFVKNCQTCDPIPEVTSIWESVDGQIAAVMHPVVAGEAFLHVHPGFRTAELEIEMLAYAEDFLSSPANDSQRKLYVLADEDDGLRQQILASRGYSRCGRPIHRWWRDLTGPIPDVPIAVGYTIRSMGDVDEFPARSWASWKAFHPDEPDGEYEGWGWYFNIQSAPLYRRDLDIVAATDGGEIAAFCTLWYDDATRSAVCVLMGTVPAHQRRGLGKATMSEGLRRLREMGSTRALANGYDPPADALYRSVLGNKSAMQSWVKVF